MFVADRLVYLQLQKTGCTHIAHILADFIDGKQIGKHNSLSSTFTGKYIIGSIRNPWDWYVSLWAFGCGRKGGLYRRLTGIRHNFQWFTRKVLRNVLLTKRVPIGLIKDTIVASHQRPTSLWYSVYRDNMDAESFRAWLRLMFDPKRSADLGEKYARSSLNRFAGFFTYRYLKLYSRSVSPVLETNYFNCINDLFEFDSQNNVLDSIIRMEALEDDLVLALTNAGYPLTEEQKDKIHSGKNVKQNASKHQNALFYYDQETIDLVAERERFIIKKYGYQLPSLC
ncbi:MAG: hypothetical protein FD167_2187 [bacterium]|nr:MAG: hypothetical protein FD167_2187 [bacterium]